MKYKGRPKSSNIEDRRKGKIKSPVKGLPLMPTFKKVEEGWQLPPVTKKVKKRGRRIIIRKDGYMMNNGKGGFR